MGTKKKRRKLKKWVRVVLAILFILLIWGCFLLAEKALNKEGPGKEQGGFFDIFTDKGDEKIDEDPEKDGPIFSYTVFDVGNALSVFIDYGETEILIDGGSYENGQIVANKIRPYVDGNIEYVFATHCHEDHVGGLQFIYKEFGVDKTIYGDLSSENYFYYFESAARKAGEFKEDFDTSISLGEDASLTVFDITDNDENPNNNSIVTLVRYKDTTFLCTGDLEKDFEAKLTTLIGKTDVVVAGHHGSNTSNSIYKYLDPSFVAISCGKDNDYYQPHPSVLRDILKYTSDVYGTFKSGDIVFTSDGRRVTCSCDISERLSIEDAGAKSEAN